MDIKTYVGPNQWGLLIVAGISVIFAVLHVFFPDRFDETTAMFLGVAIASLVVHQITKFKGFGVEFEKTVEQLKEDVRYVEEAVVGLEKGIGPGSKNSLSSAVPTAATEPVVKHITAHADSDPDDPNKGQFGGHSEVNDRKLSATIEPDAGPKSSRCKVTIRITSTSPSNPLTGTVRLHLHPTFGAWSSYDLEVKRGIAQDTIVSYGAFTIGAETDGGNTRLELDLAEVSGGTERFYEE